MRDFYPVRNRSILGSSSTCFLCIAFWRNAGPERFDEAVEYTEQNRLYESALAIWKGTEHHAVCGCFSFTTDSKVDTSF